MCWVIINVFLHIIPQHLFKAMGFGRRELQQLTIQLSLGMNMLFMGGDWIKVDWDCCTPHQWVMLVIFRIAWIYIEVMFVVGH
jgi:hypothetical protein